jgi:hypothetical protein
MVVICVRISPEERLLRAAAGRADGGRRRGGRAGPMPGLKERLSGSGGRRGMSERKSKAVWLEQGFHPSTQLVTQPPGQLVEHGQQVQYEAGKENT